MAKNTKKKRRRSARERLSTLLGLLSLLLLVVGISGIVVLRELRKIERVSTRDQAPIAVEEQSFEVDQPEEGEAPAEDSIAPEDVVWNNEAITVETADHVKNLLLIGQDRRPGEGRTRSDTMIVCSLNTETNEITLVSLLRDMYVPFPDDYWDNRINAAYAFGGMELLDRLLEEDFGLVIDGNIELDFDGFLAVMTAIGPLEIELSSLEAWYLNSEFGWNLPDGRNNLTPAQLLDYVRIRQIDTDAHRSARQRNVLTKAYNKLSDLSLTQIAALADSLLPYVTTDLSDAQLLEYVYLVASNRMTLGGQYRIPVDGSYSSENIRGMAVLVPDLAENSRLLHEYLYGAAE